MFANAHTMIANFRRAGTSMCRSRTGKNIRRGMLALLAASPLAKSSPYVPPAPSFAMAGYWEHTQSFIGTGHQPGRWQADYVKGKAELQAAMNDCAKKLATCDPRVKAIADMIERVRKVPDKVTQIEMVNAYVNTISYDNAEDEALTKAGFRYRTMKQALDANKAICMEMAELKLFALERLGFNQNDIRLVDEAQYTRDAMPVGFHAITAAHIGNNVWVMNIGAPSINALNHAGRPAEQVAVADSLIETAGTHFNFSRHSLFRGHIRGCLVRLYSVPTEDFNSTEARWYSNGYIPTKNFGNVPPQARNAAGKRRRASLDMLKKYHFMKTMLAAISNSYQMQLAEAKAERPGQLPESAKPAACRISGG